MPSIEEYVQLNRKKESLQREATSLVRAAFRSPILITLRKHLTQSNRTITRHDETSVTMRL